MRWLLFGVLLVCVVVLAAGLVFLRQARGFSTREQPSQLEQWIAREARSLALPARAKLRMNPIQSSPEILAEARAHWADHCFTCHANDGSGETPLGQQLYPSSPDLRLPATQNLTDGELFYIIQNGIRLSGMPAWGSGSAQDDEDSWKLVRFIRHLPQLTAEEKIQMKKLNPKSPDEILEEQEEEKFLKGNDNNDPSPEHHHH